MTSYLPSLNITPQILELFHAKFPRVITVQHGDHAAADVFAESIKREFCVAIQEGLLLEEDAKQRKRSAQSDSSKIELKTRVVSSAAQKSWLGHKEVTKNHVFKDRYDANHHQI